MAMDVKFGGPAMDLMTRQGFITALWNACRLAPGSGCLAAPVCSSFVYMTLGCFPKHANLGDLLDLSLMPLKYKLKIT